MVQNHAIYPSLLGKTVLITGGAAGIGAATVKLFALQGCRVLFLDINQVLAERMIDDILSASNDAGNKNKTPITRPIFYHCDLSDLAKLQSTATKILEEYETIHVLVNNAAAAGLACRIPTEKVTAESWDFNINANLRHVFFMTQAVLPSMKLCGGGSVINLGSISWRIPAAGQPVYGACKAAIMGLTKVQSKEFGAHNIRVNSVMPGAIATQSQKEQVLTPEYRAEIMQAQSLQRDLTPEEVAQVIVFLGSSESSAVTGSTYVVDGGWVSDP